MGARSLPGVNWKIYISTIVFCLTPLCFFQTTVLHLAALFNCSTELVQVLIGAGADVNAVDSSQQSPLHFASSWNPAVVPVLLEAGAKVNVLANYQQRSPLFWAARSKQEASVVALMAASADPHLGNPSPLTSTSVSDEMKALIKSLSK